MEISYLEVSASMVIFIPGSICSMEISYLEVSASTEIFSDQAVMDPVTQKTETCDDTYQCF